MKKQTTKRTRTVSKVKARVPVAAKKTAKRPSAVKSTAKASKKLSLKRVVRRPKVKVAVFKSSRFSLRLKAYAAAMVVLVLAVGVYAFQVQQYGPLKDVLAATTTSDRTAPSAPKNLTYTLSVDAKPTLRWNASTDNVKVTTYKIYRNGVLYFNRSASLARVVTLPQQAAGTSDEYKIAAVDAAGNRSNFSNKAWITVFGGPIMQKLTGTHYLSDITPTHSLNGWGPIEKDMSNGEAKYKDGKPITLNGVVYKKGIGTHATSYIRWILAGRCSQFTAKVGVDDESRSAGSLGFAVAGDNKGLWATQQLMTGNSATKTVSVNIKGVNELRLTVYGGNNGTTNDHGDWADAKIVCGDPAPAPTAGAITNPYSCPTPEPRLDVGSKGDCVKKAQWYVQKNISPNLAIDGNYGTGTKAEVLKFQKANGNNVGEGIVGDVTWAQLKKSNPYGAVCPKPEPQIKLGSTNVNCVKKLQWYLLKVQDKTMPVNGNFGSQTRTNVLAFQKANGITAGEGEVGPLTWAALYKKSMQ